MARNAQLGCLAGLLLATSASFAQESDKPNTDAAPIVSRPTVKVEKGRLVATVTLKGTLAADKRSEVKVRLKAWHGPLIVEEAAAHGATVKKGDVLLKFEQEKLEKLLAETREDRASAALAIQLAEIEVPRMEALLPLDLQAAERDKQQTSEDLERFLKVDKDQEIEAAKFALRGAEFNLEYARDELAQLEKMYQDKDLTEETEQMILKRYKFQLESSERHLETTKRHTEQTLKVSLPRREESAKLAAAKAEISFGKARDELPLQLRQRKLALEKLKHDDRRAQEKLADLEHDLEQLTIKAPTDGLVYYGRIVQGQATGAQAAAFLPGGSLNPNEVVMTIVSPGKRYLFAEAEEKELAGIKPGQPARIAPTMSPREKLNGKVDRVVPVPQGGKYDVVIAVADDAPASFVSGMTASAKIVTYERDNALFVASSAVFEDADQESFYVYEPGEKPKKKTVRVGIVAGDKTEILDGLKAGDEILASKP